MNEHADLALRADVADRIYRAMYPTSVGRQAGALVLDALALAVTRQSADAEAIRDVITRCYELAVELVDVVVVATPAAADARLGRIVRDERVHAALAMLLSLLDDLGEEEPFPSRARGLLAVRLSRDGVTVRDFLERGAEAWPTESRDAVDE